MVCAACQKELPPDARYCPACGRPLEPESGTSNLEGERRPVTVLFADVSGFTALSEQLDAEEVCRLLNGFFDALAPIAERYGGVVDKYIGDAAMVLFGAPAAHEDDPPRALHAALDMLRAVAAFNAQHGMELHIHIGVNTGPVVAGPIGSRGRRHYTVIGDAVNLAARLQEVAPPGQILVGPDTYRRAAPLFDFDPLPLLAIKGKAEAVQTYRLLGSKAQPGAVRGLAGLSSPMVGRGAELQTLVQLTEAARAGRGGAVIITGEAGLGKSRLVAEWQEASAGAVGRWAQGHCLSYGQSRPYYLLVDLLRGLIGVPAAAGEVETRAALRSLVRELPGPARDLYTYLGHLLAIRLEGEDLERVRALDPEAMQAQYLAGLRQLLRALAARGPIVLVGEDIHWADPSSVELLGRLLPVAQDLPILFCFAARPEPAAPGWKLVVTAREALADRVTELPLRTLGEADSRQLIANLLQVEALPESVRAWILKRAEGNPFYVEEVIHMLIERGALVQEDGHWAARQEITALEVPDSLQALLLARLDRLPAETRDVLRVAAVIGRKFTVRVLERVWRESANRAGLPTGTLVELLSDLETAGLIRLAQMAPELEYLFRHALVREAAYNSMLREDRRRLHQVVGTTLEELYPGQVGELAAMLAHHFGLAEDAPRALRYLLLAADAAFERYAVVEAIDHYSRALATAREVGPAAAVPWLRLYQNLGRALELDSRYERAVETYGEMQEVARAHGDRAMELVALTEHAKVHATPTAVHNAAQGQALAEQALALARQLGDRPAEARIEWVLLIVNWMQGETAAALAHGERSLALARELRLREQLAYTLHDIHRSRLNAGDREGAKAALAEARALWRELNNLPLLADNLASAADLLTTLGEYDPALESAQEAWQLSRAIGNRWNQAFGLGMVGEIYQVHGEFGPALAALREAHEISARAGPVIMYLRLCRDLAQVYLELNALEEARQALRPVCEEEHLEMPMRGAYRAEGLLLLAQVELQAGAVAAAGALLEQCLAEQPEARQRRPLNLAIARADIALGRGEHAQALRAIENYREMVGERLTFSQSPRLELLKGQALLGLGRLAEAVAVLRAAAEQVRRRRLRPRLWPILLTLGRCEALRRNAVAAAEAFGEARQVVEAIAAAIEDARLRDLFLGRPDVRALLAME